MTGPRAAGPGRSVTIRQAAIESRSIAPKTKPTAKSTSGCRASVLSDPTFRRRGSVLVPKKKRTNVDPSEREDDDARSSRRSSVAARRAGDRGGARSRRPDVSLAADFPREIERRGQVGVVKPPRARGGCLGVAGQVGVAGCDKLGGGAERPSIPRYPQQPRELKHLSTWRNGKQPRLPQ